MIIIYITMLIGSVLLFIAGAGDVLAGRDYGGDLLVGWFCWGLGLLGIVAVLGHIALVGVQ